MKSNEISIKHLIIGFGAKHIKEYKTWYKYS